MRMELDAGKAWNGSPLFELFEGIVRLRISVSSESESQAAVWDRLLRLRPSFFRQFSSGDLQSRVTAVNEVGRELSDGALSALFSTFVAVLNLGLLYLYSSSLSMLAVAVYPILAIASIGTGRLPANQAWLPVASGAIALLVIWRHRSNIQRLFEHREARLGARRGTS